MQKIEVTINPDGSLEYKVQGVKGRGCRDLTKTLDKISGKVLETKDTAEMRERETETEHLRQK